MIKAVILIAIIEMFSYNSFGQKPITIQGTVEDSIGNRLSNATVKIVASNDSMSMTTSKHGDFKFSMKQMDSFKLRITMKGFHPYEKHFCVDNNNSTMQMPSIILYADYAELEPVVVSKVRPLVISGDTLTYNTASFVVPEGSEIQAILKRLPGVELDMQGNVIVQGKKISRVMVDGKLFFGGDIKTAIQNLPADIVDKLQVIDDYGDKARLTGVKSGESEKVLNIALKQNKRNGQFGHVQLGLGNQNKYTADIFGNMFKGDQQLALNASLENNNLFGNSLSKHSSISYADKYGKKWTQSGNANISEENTTTENNTTQDNYFSQGYSRQNQSVKNTTTSKGSNVSSTITLTPDALHSLRVNSSIGMQYTALSAQTAFSILQNENSVIKLNDGTSTSSTAATSYSGGTELYYEQLSAKSRKRFNIQMNLHFSNNNQTTHTKINNTTTLDSQKVSSTQHYLINNDNPGLDLEGTFTYFSPLGKKGFLEAGYTWQSSTTHNKKTIALLDSLQIQPMTIDSLSQNYFYSTINQRYHLGYTASITKINFTIGLNVQQGYLNGNTLDKDKEIQYRYFNWLPGVQVSYALSKNKSIAIQYNGTSSLPSLQQVQPITDISNPQYPIIGNPSLKPSYTQNAFIHYEQSIIQSTNFQSYGISLGYSTTQHPIISNITHPQDSGSVVQKTYFLNTDCIYSLYSNYHLDLPTMLYKRVRVVINGSFSSNHGIAMTDNVLYGVNSLITNQNIHIQSMIPNFIESDLSGNYDYVHTRYLNKNTALTSFSSFGWGLGNRHTFWQHWILNYQMSQTFLKDNSNTVQVSPITTTASAQRQLLKKNKGTISIFVYDLLNSTKSASQSLSSTDVTKTQTTFIGRYFVVQFVLKWDRFRN